jgi:hypothetical protein
VSQGRYGCGEKRILHLPGFDRKKETREHTEKEEREKRTQERGKKEMRQKGKRKYDKWLEERGSM